MKIHIDKAMRYLHEHFVLDETTSDLCRAVLNYWNDYCEDGSIETYLTKLLGPLNFDKDDVKRMISDEIIFI